MCQSVKIDGQMAFTVAELAAHIGFDRIVWYDGDDPDSISPEDDCCLCGMDPDATARGIGRTAIQTDWDSMCYEFAAP